MLVPVIVAVSAVALGTILALIPAVGARALWPVRAVAAVAALSVVLLHLMPEAFGAIGAGAIIAALAGLLVPSIIEWVGGFFAARSETPDAVAREIGYAALLVHQVGDGLGLWAYAGPVHASVDVALALAAHTVPITMIVVLQFTLADGWRAAIVRAGGLAGATLLGVVAATFVSIEWWRMGEPWTAAVVAGLLAHVVIHDVRASLRRTSHGPVPAPQTPKPPPKGDHAARELGPANE